VNRFDSLNHIPHFIWRIHLYVSANGSICHSISSNCFVAFCHMPVVSLVFQAVLMLLLQNLMYKVVHILAYLPHFNRAVRLNGRPGSASRESMKCPLMCTSFLSYSLLSALCSYLFACNPCMQLLLTQPTTGAPAGAPVNLSQLTRSGNISKCFIHTDIIPKKKINLPNCDYWEWIGSCPGVGVLLSPVVRIHSYSLQLVM
jgi:hypothetical protein